MPVDPSVVGTELPAITMTVDASWLRFFAKAIGETSEDYAGAGDRLPVPPTFLFGLELEAPDSFRWLADLGVDLRLVLHGEQSFVYHSPAHSGDTLTARPRITDVYAKKGGALEFIVKQTEVTRADGSAVAELTSTLVVRHPEAGR
jgi:hypothetical protein